MTDHPDNILSKLPARLKEARQVQGLSLESVARLSGVSRSMVSQIERGESSPTIATLWNLTRALQVDFAGLLDGETDVDHISVLRAADVPVIDNMGKRCRIRILSPPQDAGRNEVYELQFEPGGMLSSQPHAHGACETMTVIEGALQVTSGNSADRLGPGDTARYAADVEHSISAPDEHGRAYLVVSYG